VRPFGIAGIQMYLKPDPSNIETMRHRLDLLMHLYPWVQMVMFSELAPCGPLLKYAQTMPGPAEESFQEMAARHRIWLLPGSMFERHGGAIYNTASVINPQGKVIGRYRKLFPFYPFESGVAAGNEFLVFDVDSIGRFGVSICYDMWFPETTRTLAWLGAEVILHPTMTNTIDREVELSIARANAAMNQCYFVDINVAGDLGLGRSGIYGPGGEVIYQAGSGGEVLAVELDLDSVRRARQRGWHSQVQPLKSFRDSTVAFPAYVPGERQSPYLRSLGPLQMPVRPTLQSDET